MGHAWDGDALLFLGSLTIPAAGRKLLAFCQLSLQEECHPALAVMEPSLFCRPVCTGSLFGALELLEPVLFKQSTPERCSRQILVREMQVLAGLLSRAQVVCVLEHCSTSLPGKPL